MDWLLLMLPVGLVCFGTLVINSTQRNLGDAAYGWNHLLLGLL
jgi:hypothetical protein